MTLNKLKKEIDKLIEKGYGEKSIWLSVGRDDLTNYSELTTISPAFLDCDGEPIDEEYCDRIDKCGEAVISFSGWMD